MRTHKVGGWREQRAAWLTLLRCFAVWGASLDGCDARQPLSAPPARGGQAGDRIR